MNACAEYELRFLGGLLDGEIQTVTCDPPRHMPDEIRVTSKAAQKVDAGWLSRFYHIYRLKRKYRNEQHVMTVEYEFDSWNSFANEGAQQDGSQ